MKDVRALVVDDAPEVRKLIRVVLWGMGIKAVEEASNGLEALSILKKNRRPVKRRPPSSIWCCAISTCRRWMGSAFSKRYGKGMIAISRSS